MAIKIYGASDDLIEIEGDIQEEFNWFPKDENEKRLLAVSDGTLLRIWYDEDGIWRINKIASGLGDFQKIEGDVMADTNDIVIISGNTKTQTDIKWVVLGEEFAT